MSLLSKFFFDPLLAAAARAMSSINPAAQAVGQAAAAAVANTVTADVATNTDHNSAMGLSNPIIGQLESDLNNAVTAFVEAIIAKDIPVAGVLIAPEIGKLTLTALTFAEEHALTYLAQVFHFHATNNLPVTTAAAPNAPQKQAEVIEGGQTVSGISAVG
jgi:hypothetical protein